MSHPTSALDDVVHQRSRLGILAILSTGDRVDFGYLRQVLDLSAGNLSRHLTMLVEARLITVEKGYHGRRPRTWVVITRAGSKAYEDEMSVLRSLLALADAASGEQEPASPGEPSIHPGEPGDNAGERNIYAGEPSDNAGEPPIHAGEPSDKAGISKSSLPAH